MAPENEDIDELMEQLKNLKRKRDEISGDTNRILIEQRQLDQSAVNYLDMEEEMSPPSPRQMVAEPMITCACGRSVPSRYRHCPHCGRELVEP
jgi:hypothetical protein